MTCENHSHVDASQETRLTVQALKIERLEEKQDELRERLKAVEKWVIGAAAVLAAGVGTFHKVYGDGSELINIGLGGTDTWSQDAQGNLVSGTNAGDSFSGTDANNRCGLKSFLSINDSEVSGV